MDGCLIGFRWMLLSTGTPEKEAGGGSGMEQKNSEGKFK